MAKPTSVTSFPLVGGLNTFTVPADATYWVLGLSWWTPSPNTLNSPTINFGTVASGSLTTSAGTAGSPFDQFIAHCHGPVTSTGSGRTIDISWSNASADEGPSGFIHFFKGQHATVPVLNVGIARSTEANVAGTATVNTNADCICVAIDAGYREFAMPTTVSGWTFDQAQDNNNANRAAIYRRDTPTTPTQTFTGVSQYYRSVLLFSLQGASGGDTTAPILTSPTGTKTGTTTATGTVTTDEANGTLYRLASTNSTETASTVITAALSQAVTTTGVQNVTFTGLTPGTTYYAHYVHVDAASNQSTRVSSASFATDPSDTTAPTLTSPTGTATGSTTATGTVSTNEANGTLYRLASTNATETAGTVIAAALSQSVTATGVQNVTFTGLTASTTYYAHYVHVDAASNQSTRVSSASFTTSAPTVNLPTLIGGTFDEVQLGESATPTGWAGTVAANAKIVVVMFDQSNFAGLSSLTSNFTGAFTTLVRPQISTSGGGVIAWATVTTRGTGRTIVPVFTSANNIAPSIMHVGFFDDVDPVNPVIDMDTGQSPDGGTPGTMSLDSEVNSMVVFRDYRIDAPSGNYPDLGAGFTNIRTSESAPSSLASYRSVVRVKRVTTPVAGTNAATASTQNTQGSYISGIAIRYGVADTTAPTLTSATGTQTGSTTASGTVTTNEANGTLYRQASTTAAPSAATVIAAGLTQAVTATGVQNVTFTGLTPSTAYYAHYVHVDASGNQSTRVSSTQFTTTAGDTTAPTLSSPTGTQTGTTTASGTVSTNEANGTLYRLASTAPTPSAATVIAANLTQTVTATGVQNVTFTGLTPSTTYYAHYVHVDAASNQSTRVSSTTFTTAAAATPPVVTITTQTHSGQQVTVAGTYTSTATSGTVSIAVGGTPNGAVAIPPTAATVGSGAFSITFTAVATGNYAAPAVSLTGPGGVGTANGTTFSILGLAGTPQAS